MTIKKINRIQSVSSKKNYLNSKTKKRKNQISKDRTFLKMLEDQIQQASK